jgi:hypothetical protein
MLVQLQATSPGAMLVGRILSYLGPEQLVCTVLCSKWLYETVCSERGVATTLIENIISQNMFLSRWIRHTAKPLKELFDIHRAIFHQEREAGRYAIHSGFMGSDIFLDIAPNGRFMNHSTSHCYAGSCTITAVIEANHRIDLDSRDWEARGENYHNNASPKAEFYVLLDRWYTECLDGNGELVPASEMSWVDEDYRCYSVCGSVAGAL